MAGGKFVTMNKVIPGAYFALQSQAPVQSLLSPIGVLAWVAPQIWGPEIAQISLADYARDNCYAKIGRHNADDRMQIFSQYCNTLICVNPAKGRAAAQAQIRAAQADGVNLYIKLGIKTAKLPAATDSLAASISAGKVSLDVADDQQQPVAGYAKSLSIEELVAGDDDTYIAELYKKDGANFVLVNPDGMSFTSLSGSVSETVGSLVASGPASWVGPSDAVGSLRCQRLAGALNAIAQQPGSLGNLVSLSVVSLANGKKEVRTTVDGVVVERQRVSTWEKFVDNEWVRLEGEKTFAPAPIAAINLAGGSDGIVEPEQIVSESFTVSAKDYHYAAVDNNHNVDSISLAISNVGTQYTLKLMKSGEQVGADVVATNTIAHRAYFELPNGGELELVLMDDASGEPVKDNVDVAATSGTPALSGGNHGVIVGIGDALEILRDEMYNVVVCDRQDTECNRAIADFILDLTDNQGKDRRAVICVPQDNASPEQLYDCKELTVLGQAMDNDASITAFCVAAMSAGASWNEAITYAPVPLTGDPSIKLNDEQLEDWINAGFMPISKREDGVWCITKDINSLHGDDDGLPELCKKNRCIRVIQTMRNTIKFVWETQYVGKVTNDALGRDMFKASICAILDLLVNGRGIAPYDSRNIIVAQGNKPDEVLLQMAFSIYDSMEILYVTMTL